MTDDPPSMTETDPSLDHNARDARPGDTLHDAAHPDDVSAMFARARIDEAEVTDAPVDPDWDPTVRQSPNDRFTPAQIIAALEASAGIKLGAAQKLRCSASTVGYYVKRYPQVAVELERIQEERLDIAETLLLKRMTTDAAPALQLTAIIFYLKTKGAKRGYSERFVHAGDPEQPLEINNKVRFDWDKLSVEELRIVEGLVTRARTRDDTVN